MLVISERPQNAFPPMLVVPSGIIIDSPAFSLFPLEFPLSLVFTVYVTPPIELSPMYAVAVSSLPFFVILNVSSVAPVFVFSASVPAAFGVPV